MKLSRNQKAGGFEAIGGLEGCRRLSERFHERVAGDPALKRLFPKNLAPTTEHLALFIAQQLGGPNDYLAKRGKQSLLCRHAHLPIGSEEAAMWLGNMFASIDEIGIRDPLRQNLRDYFSGTAPTLTDPFLPLYRLPIEELVGRLEKDPALAIASHMGRTLLTEAAQRWDLPRVQLLLERGASPNAGNDLDHGPLYRATNGSVPGSEAEGRAVVELLVRFGADVNRPSGPGRSAPLHMTARRGHVSLAQVLLTGGADLEQRDSKGETPLRRAVNCGQMEMVVFLLSQGADPYSKDKGGRSPLTVARQERIRQALQTAARTPAGQAHR